MATTTDPRAAELLRRRESRPDQCVHCKGRLNTFNKSTYPHCRLTQPSGPDLEPVTRRAPDTPAPAPAPAKTPEEPMISTPEPAAPPRPKPCPTCGKPTHPANGRCYECRPGGGKGHGDAGEATLAGTPLPLPLPIPRRPRVLAAVAPGAALDPEVAAIAATLAALDGLDDRQIQRVLTYVKQRVQPDGEG